MTLRSLSHPAAIALALLTACAVTEEGDPPPAAAFRFPAGIALSPEDPSLPQRLLVVSSNFDLRYRSGVLHALDREAVDRLVDEAPPSPGCPASSPRCRPAAVQDLEAALIGAVEIGDYGGEVAVANLGAGRLRAFVPVRGSREVVAVELDAAGIHCAKGGEPRCEGIRFPREDPYSVVVSLGNVFVGHSTVLDEEPRNGVIASAQADALGWSEEGGAFERISVGRTAIGGLAIGDCRSDPEDGEVCTLFASGRSRSSGFQPIFAIDHREGEAFASPLFSRDIFAQSKGFDSRGIAAASASRSVYLASRSPDALAVIDVSRTPRLPSDGCILPEGEEVPPGEACPTLPPPVAVEPRFATSALIPAPRGPNALRTLPRESPSGDRSDLVVMTTSQGLAFIDLRSGRLVGELDGLGGAPSDIAFRSNGDGGYRLYVTSFTTGTLAVVDLPDPFQPQGARAVALLGPQQERESL